MIEPGTLYQHSKGGVYRIVDIAIVQAAGPIGDLADVVVYRSEHEGTLWVRPVGEFKDGRFTAVPSTSEAADAGHDPDDGWEWAVVEVFGHRKHAGRIREEERFGAKMMRVDVPNKGDPAAHGWTTHYYAGGSIFSLTPAERETCLKANAPYDRPARSAYRPQVEDDEGWHSEP